MSAIRSSQRPSIAALRFQLATESLQKSQPAAPRYGSVQKRAFALVELIVVVSIIGVLTALLLPAVQAVREAARRIKCQSNLKQMGLAAINFESANRRFPSGGWGYQWPGFADISSPAGQPGSWTFSLLPFVEQSVLYVEGSYEGHALSRDESLHRRTSTPVPLYVCPSRRGGYPIPFDPNCPSCPEPIGVSLPLRFAVRGDYAANAGDGVPEMNMLSRWPLDFWGPADLADAKRLSSNRRWPKPPHDWSGISWLATGTSVAELTDGMSHIFLFGEKYVMQDAYRSGTDWGDNEPLYGGFNNDNHRSTHPHWPIMQDQRGRMSIGSFGSAHASGVNFAMADGSVHQVAYTVDGEVYRYLGNRHDASCVEVPK